MGAQVTPVHAQHRNSTVILAVGNSRIKEAMVTVEIKDSDIPGLAPGHSSIQRAVIRLPKAPIGLGVATLGIRDGLIRETEVPDKTNGIMAIEMG